MYSNVSNIVESSAGRIGLNPKEFKRFVKFAVVGLIGAVVDFGVLNILRVVFDRTLDPLHIEMPIPIWGSIDLDVWLSVAAGISFIAAIISNFIWNRYWTYSDSRSKSFAGQFTQFFLVNFLGILIRLPIVASTSSLFKNMALSAAPSMQPGTADLIGDNLSVVLAVVVVMFWNFFVNRYWTYNDID